MFVKIAKVSTLVNGSVGNDLHCKIQRIEEWIWELTLSMPKADRATGNFFAPQIKLN